MRQEKLPPRDSSHTPQLAELLLEHYPDERAEAIALLDESLSLFRELGMRPLMERALRHREMLGA